MKRKFIKIDCGDGENHIIPIDQIRYVSPKKEGVFKSKVILLGEGSATCYSTNTQSEIYDLIIKENRKP